jgi:hypothetical protein
MIVTIEIDFEIGETVFLKTDIDQMPRMVVAIIIGGNNSILYRLASATNETVHYACEITHEKSPVMI